MAQRISHPFDAADERASRAIRLFPTPAAPQTTIPERSDADIAMAISRISHEWPVSGHAKRIRTLSASSTDATRTPAKTSPPAKTP